MSNQLVSVIIPTFNRAEFLSGALASLAAQTLPREQFQVVVVDDGSTDETAEAVRSFQAHLNVTYRRTDHLGIAAAKNAGIAESVAPILLFSDDDDLSDAHLLEEHLKTHEQYPSENMAVLGFTGWAPHVERSPIMLSMPELKDSPFVYKDLHGGEVLDFLFFWGGRSSCKKSLLTRCGIFDAQFVWGEEDIELGSRLANSAGLQVVFNRSAVSLMARPVTFDSLCVRSVRQGRSMFQFSRCKPGPAVRRYLGTQLLDPTTWRPLELDQGIAKWQEIEPVVELESSRIRKMESALRPDLPHQKRDFFLGELNDTYWWVLAAFKLKGFALAMSEHNALAGQGGGRQVATGSMNGQSPESDDSPRLAELRRRLANDEALLRARQAYLERLEYHVESLWKEIDWREGQIRRMKGTRLWRLDELFWRIEGKVAAIFGRRKRA